jgi:hypothetical protein
MKTTRHITQNRPYTGRDSNLTPTACKTRFLQLDQPARFFGTCVLFVPRLSLIRIITGINCRPIAARKPPRNMKVVIVIIFFPSAERNSPRACPLTPYPLTESGFKAVPQVRLYCTFSLAAWPVPVIQIPHCGHVSQLRGATADRTAKPPSELAQISALFHAHQILLPPECTTVLAVSLRKHDKA